MSKHKAIPFDQEKYEKKLRDFVIDLHETFGTTELVAQGTVAFPECGCRIHALVVIGETADDMMRLLVQSGAVVLHPKEAS